MIETLVPALECAEMFSDAPESTLFSSEAATVSNAVTERRREFATVRYCARKALLKMRVQPVPILPDVDGAPQWPIGVVGSMTHCSGYRAAVVALSRQISGVGIDAEPHAAVPRPALDLILRDARDLTAVAIAPDLGERYLETIYQADWLRDTYGDDVLDSVQPSAASRSA